MNLPTGQLRSDPGAAEVVTLRSRLSGAAMLTFGSHLASQAIRFGGNLLLTRLLVPEAFGVMLLATVLWIGLSMLSDMGFRQVIIRSPNGSQGDFLDTVWTMQVIQGAIVSILLILTGFALMLAQGSAWLPRASTWSDPDLPLVVASLSIGAMLSSAQSTSLDLAQREMRMVPLIAIEIGSQVLGLLVTLASAFHGLGVYSLVIGASTAAAGKLLLSHTCIAGPSHRLFLSPMACKEIIVFGRWIVATSCAGFLISNGDRLLLGWLLPSREMGNYAVAILVISAGHELVGKILGRVVYPAFSAVHSADPKDLRKAYLSARHRLDFLCMTAAGLLMPCGDLLIGWLYDARYGVAGSYLGALSLSFLGIRYRVMSQVFMVIGRPRLMLYEQVIHGLALAIGTLVGFHAAGAFGAVLGISLSYVLAQIWTIFWAQPMFGLLDIRLELNSLALFAILAGSGLLARALLG